jgi:hypothetical protein
MLGVTALISGDLREEPYAGKPPVRICEGEAEWPSYSTSPFRHPGKVLLRYNLPTVLHSVY